MSASAAEIFTAALRDTDRAVVVGDSRTFGKGTVLSVDSLDRYNRWFGGNRPPAGTLTFETAMFYRSTGGSVQQLGITPDIKLPSLTEEMKIGEIYMDNHLPWDSIPALSREKFYPDLDAKISILRKLSEERRNSSAQFKLFLQQINIYKQLRDRKAVSLNEEKRYRQYLKEKEVADEVEKLMSDAAEKDKTKKPAPDFVLNEALNIAADFYEISGVKIYDGK
jgi:carboxyl-terminal processing protease